MKEALKPYLSRALGRLADLRICSIRPRGRFLFADLRRSIRKGATLVDVGASTGEWSMRCLRSLPQLYRIICFEPMPDAFRVLQRNIGGRPGVECLQIALGDTGGSSKLFLGAHSTTHSLIPRWADQASVDVELDTLEHFCASRSIGDIDLLKIDTEGYDLKVLAGAKSLLQQGRIHFVLTEVCFNDRVGLPLFDHTRAFMQENGYQLFGLYDQQPYWDGRPAVLYANACFVRQPVS